ARQHPYAQRIDLPAALEHLVVKVRPGGHAAGPDIADHVALLHPRATLDAAREAAEMRVGGGIAVIVPDADIAPVSAVMPGHGDRAVARRIDRCARGCREI